MAKERTIPNFCTCDKLPEFDMDGTLFSGCCRFCETEINKATEDAYDNWAQGWNGSASLCKMPVVPRIHGS